MDERRSIFWDKDPTPREVLMDVASRAVSASFLSPCYRTKPGEFLMRQPPEVREKLKQLTSDDANFWDIGTMWYPGRKI